MEKFLILVQGVEFFSMQPFITTGEEQEVTVMDGAILISNAFKGQISGDCYLEAVKETKDIPDGIYYLGSDGPALLIKKGIFRELMISSSGIGRLSEDEFKFKKSFYKKLYTVVGTEKIESNFEIFKDIYSEIVSYKRKFTSIVNLDKFSPGVLYNLPRESLKNFVINNYNFSNDEGIPILPILLTYEPSYQFILVGSYNKNDFETFFMVVKRFRNPLNILRHIKEKEIIRKAIDDYNDVESLVRYLVKDLEAERECENILLALNSVEKIRLEEAGIKLTFE